ncbi:hypothetical protein [Pseudomonas sp. RIT-To-2]|uniref:hypothetical protein n=1 Tax=Pseudomonas sp. RIT-To-2 TaxID=3462541 RepID=UPI0024138720
MRPTNAAKLLFIATLVITANSFADILQSPEYKKPIEVFFGGMSGSYIPGSKMVGAQVIDALTIQDDVRPIVARSSATSAGSTLLTGCRQHSCFEKAAVVLDAEKNVLAAALISYKCQMLNGSPKHATCDKTPTLTIFTPPHSEEVNSKTLENWGLTKSPNIPIEYKAVAKSK